MGWGLTECPGGSCPTPQAQQQQQIPSSSTRVLMRGRTFLMVVELTTRVLMRGRTFPLGKLKLYSASR